MTSVMKTTESSAIVSLHELMALEERRLHDEEADRVRKAEAERRAAADKIEADRKAEAARVEAERAAQAERDRADREHQAHLAAMRDALIEQERIKAERQAEQHRDAARMANEREMARIAEQSAAKKMRKALLGVSLGAVAVIAGGLGLYFGKIKPEAETQAAAHAQEARDAQAARDASERARLATLAQIEQLQKDLAAARTPAEQATINDKINTLKKATPGPLPRVTTKVEAPKSAPCAKGDPMCKDL